MSLSDALWRRTRAGVGIPTLDRKQPSTSYMTRGRDRLRVDLVVPTRERTAKVLPVAELRTHAMGLPHLRYLVAESIEGLVVGRHGAVPVRIPRPERRRATSEPRTSSKRPCWWRCSPSNLPARWQRPSRPFREPFGTRRGAARSTYGRGCLRRTTSGPRSCSSRLFSNSRFREQSVARHLRARSARPPRGRPRDRGWDWQSSPRRPSGR